MKTLVTLLAFLPACAGDPFVIGEDPAATSTGPGLGALDARVQASDATPDAAPGAPEAGDAAALETGKPEAGAPEAGVLGEEKPDEKPVCSPVVVTFDAQCHPAPQAISFPGSYVVSRFLPADNGCLWVSAKDTPAQCRCAETFTCACLLAAGVLDSSEKCEDFNGAPWVW